MLSLVLQEILLLSLLTVVLLVFLWDAGVGF